jgi:hypothetical protein
MNALFSLYDALLGIQVPPDRARAVVEAMEHDMITALATKSDLGATQLFLKQEVAATRDSLRQDMDLLRTSMTVRLGSRMIVGLGVLFAALKLT